MIATRCALAHTLRFRTLMWLEFAKVSISEFMCACFLVRLMLRTGSIYIGNWRNDEIEGQGRLQAATWAYNGQWRRGQPHGLVSASDTLRIRQPFNLHSVLLLIVAPSTGGSSAASSCKQLQDSSNDV